MNSALKIRTFIAVRLPPAVLQALGEVSEQVAREWPEKSVRWVRPENMHLTLRFLGDTEGEKVPALGAGLDEVAGEVAPFELQLDGMGCFPNARRPRVVWVGLQDSEERLVQLQKVVERLVRQLGWKREEGRRFRPHLTLGRVRERQRPPAGEWIQVPPSLSFRVGEVELIESRLKPSGAEYTTLHRSALQKRPEDVE